METKTYRVALIGAGMIANSAHIPAMLDMDGRFTLVGVQDVREEAGRFTARKQGIPYSEDAEMKLNEL